MAKSLKRWNGTGWDTILEPGFTGASVSGQASLAASASGLLTFAAGSGMSITTASATNTLTFTPTSNNFGTITVATQSDLVADALSDVLTFAAGSGMTITTTPSSDTVTFATLYSTGSQTLTSSFTNVTSGSFPVSWGIFGSFCVWSGNFTAGTATAASSIALTLPAAIVPSRNVPVNATNANNVLAAQCNTSGVITVWNGVTSGSNWGVGASLTNVRLTGAWPI